MLSKRLIATIVLGGSLTVIGGCAGSGSSSSRAAASQRSATPVSRPVPVRSTRVQAEIAPCGTVPYDMQSLPLVSPDARYIATQTQVSPTWATVLARHDAEVPLATRVEIYALDTVSGPSRIAFVDQPVVLGRSFNREGFLVEAPNPDGSRWIGLAAWDTGEIEWLVTGSDVNAFACLGPDGRLAWNRRDVDGPEDEFELVVRHGDQEWALPAEEESWLMPTWTGRGDSLVALVLDEGNLSAVHASARDHAALGQSRRSIHLAAHASVLTAYQTIGAQVHSPDVETAEQFVFHHPAKARMAVWHPRRGSSASLTFLDSNTFAAVLEGEDHALVTTEKHLMWQSLREVDLQRQLIAGLQVPRATSADHWQYILLSPIDGAIGVTAMHRIP